VEGSGHVLVQGTIPAFFWTEENYEKPQLEESAGISHHMTKHININKRKNETSDLADQKY
jgi:hypothetical protein